MILATLDYEKAKIQNGYTDRYLAIDLGRMEMEIKIIPEQTRRMFIGGRGYCLKLVYDGMKGKTAYDSPENVLALSGGPFCGEAGFAGTGKFIVGAISPLTGTFCDSNVGGYFFPLVKQAGFDAISVVGKADREVIVFIDSEAGQVRIETAPEEDFSLFDAESYLDLWRGSNKPSSIAYISTGSGARHTLYGCINSVYYDVRRKRCRAKQAGRGGLGTVMRDKGLWAMVVHHDLSSGLSNRPADSKRLREAGKKLRGVIQKVDPNHLRLGKQGTTALLDLMNAHELLPVNNYQFGSDEREKAISGAIFEKQVFKQKLPDGCFPGCNLACTKGCERHEVKTGPFAGRITAVDGPEYETAASVTNLGIFDIGWILEYTWYCDQYGVDTISTGVSMAFLFEAFQRGFITEADTDGLELKWGDAETVMELLHRIGAGAPGIARIIGMGIRRMKTWVAQKAASRNGRTFEDILSEVSLFAMECKGLEFSLYISKESLAQQGGYGFALKGPQHDEAWLIFLDQVNNEMPTFEKKAAALKWFPLFRTWFNIAGLCKLPWIDVRHPEAKDTPDPAKNLPSALYYVELVNATFGTRKTLDDLLVDSERSYILHKLINLRQGFGTRDHDRIPLRAMAPVFENEFNSRRDYYLNYLEETVGVKTDGKTDRELLFALQDYRREQYEKLVDAVYKEKGYDADGIPMEQTLIQLGFEEENYLEIVRAARPGAGPVN